MNTTTLNARNHGPMQEARLSTSLTTPVTATPLAVAAMVGVATVVSGFGWAYGW
ncbi:hypothetical protein ACPPVW_18310 [Leifsonia sp. McL0607]|uniref:hypothetical protein n=1 Tax=Leifsonia sp. McL0607 TaxID=3415672 RepID=UPI003CF9E0D9